MNKLSPTEKLLNASFMGRYEEVKSLLFIGADISYKDYRSVYWAVHDDRIMDLFLTNRKIPRHVMGWCITKYIDLEKFEMILRLVSLGAGFNNRNKRKIKDKFSLNRIPSSEEIMEMLVLLSVHEE